MVELNVMEQVLNLAKISFIQEEWENGEFPQIHGLVYSLKDGVLKDLDSSISSMAKMRPVYHLNNELLGKK